MSPVAIVFWILAVGVMLAPEVAVLYFFMCTAVFGALNTLQSPINLLPQTVAALLLAARVLWAPENRRIVLASLMNWRGFSLLAGFVVWGVLSGLILPRVFEGRIDVIAMDNPIREKLAPSSSNINQSAYLIVDLISALSLFAYLKCDRKGEVREHFMKALAISGVLFIATGLLEYSSIAPGFVGMFKTASYAMFGETEVAHVRRATGFFSEASAYGPRCVAQGALLFFARSACRSSLWRVWICPGVSLVLVAMGALSTSSTAFICIFVFLAMLGIRVGLRIYRRGAFSEYALELGVMGFGVAVLGIAWLAQPDLLNVPITLLNAMVFHKAESSSFYERSFWNHTGKLAFFETWGIGAGAGSARTSNWAISVLSNTGVLGAVLMAGYLGVLFVQAGSATSRGWAALSRGGKYSLLVVLAGLLASGTNIDPGLNFISLAAVIAAGSQWSDAIGASGRRKSKSKSSSRSAAPRRSRRRSSQHGEASPQTV